MRALLLYAIWMAAEASSGPALAAERKIYKCNQPSGVVVFSEHECGADAKEVGSISTATTPAQSSAAPSNALRDISDSAEDASCRHDAERLGNIDSGDQTDELIRRRDALRGELSYANNNLAGAVWEQGMRKQIGDLDIAIQQERTRVSLLYTQAQAAARDALSACDKRSAARDERRAAGTAAAAQQ